jgi:flagellar FliL protein
VTKKPETLKNAVPPAPEVPAAQATPVAKNKSKRLLAPLLALLLVSLTVAGAWFGGLRNHPAFAFEKKLETGASAKTKMQSFVPLEPFTVNLQDADRERFLQLGVVLEANDGHATDGVKQKLPIIRSQILLLLSSKRSTDLQGLEAKQKLAGEIIVRARQSLDSDAPDKGIEQVHFSQFMIQ